MNASKQDEKFGKRKKKRVSDSILPYFFESFVSESREVDMRPNFEQN